MDLDCLFINGVLLDQIKEVRDEFRSKCYMLLRLFLLITKDASMKDNTFVDYIGVINANVILSKEALAILLETSQRRIIFPQGDQQNIALNFINKMKVYSASKLRRNHCPLNEVIKTNITQLASLLKCTSSQSLSLTPSMQSLNAEEEAINLAKEFVSNLSDPFQLMILYPLVLDCSFTCPPDPLFQYTSFPQELHPLLSLYLYKCTSYTSLDRRSRKVIDLFYRYVSEVGGQAYETWLGQENNRSLGEWFYTECISCFFQLLYKDQESYTVFLTNYLKYGLPYLFLSATASLRGAHNPPECESAELDRIRTRYIGKHNID